MKRFLFGTVALLLTLGIAFFIEGGNILRLFLISPFLITFGIPLFAVLAIWDLGTWGRAWRNAVAAQDDPATRAESAMLWEFHEKICYAAGFIAFVVGCIIILSTEGLDAARLRECFAVNCIAPLYATFFAIVDRILRCRILARK